MVSDSTGSYLPDECWERILKSFVKDDRRRYLNPLSLVSKQLLSITNRLRCSLTVYDETQPFLGSLFKRFTNLTSLDMSYYRCDLDALLIQISCFPSLNITSLKLPDQCTIPAYGLRALSQNNTTLVSLTCCKNFIDEYDMLLIADCFPLLKELNLGHPLIKRPTNFFYGIHSLLSKCRIIQHLDLMHACFLKDRRVAKLSLVLGDLVSINLSECTFLTELSLFYLVRNCPSLSEIKMECTSIGKKSFENSNSLRGFVGRPKLKSLCLAHCELLGDQNIMLFTSIFPNLEALDLSYCNDVTEDVLKLVVENCTQMRELRHCYSKD